jgi:hypothetical protein
MHSIQPEYSRVAQLVEQVAVNHRVAGSSPAAGADTNPAWRCPTTLCRVCSLGHVAVSEGQIHRLGVNLVPRRVKRPSRLCGPCRRSSIVTSGRWLYHRGPASLGAMIVSIYLDVGTAPPGCDLGRQTASEWTDPMPSEGSLRVPGCWMAYLLHDRYPPCRPRRATSQAHRLKGWPFVPIQ